MADDDTGAVSAPIGVLCMRCRAACTHDYAPCPFCVCDHENQDALDLDAIEKRYTWATPEQRWLSDAKHMRLDVLALIAEVRRLRERIPLIAQAQRDADAPDCGSAVFCGWRLAQRPLIALKVIQ